MSLKVHTIATTMLRIGRRRLTVSLRPRRRIAALLARLLLGAWRAIFGTAALARLAMMAGPGLALAAGPAAVPNAPLLPNALPRGGALAAGQATISQAGNAMTVVQGSDKAILNWNSFNIGSQASVTFRQPGADAVILNRVMSNEPSQLLGALSGNGKVWLINPAGIMIGQGAQIDLHSFVASTLAVKNEDFLAGRLRFQMTPDAGALRNDGSIKSASGGSVYLVAPDVDNRGIIHAPGGEVILAAGQSVTLIDSAMPGVKVEIQGAAGNVTNLGRIVSEAGRIGIAGVLVKNSGTLNAGSAVGEGGRIFLRALGDAYVDGNAVLDASGGPGAKGGTVEVLGQRVALLDQATIDASGGQGGGTVLVGGDVQGGNAAVPNAQAVYFGPRNAIRADALERGDGGKVVLWSDGLTQFLGTISARGGRLGGAGGFIETSGKRQLVALGNVDVQAPAGAGGHWLLDPNDITISGDNDANFGQLANGIFSTNADSGVLNVATLAAALNNGATVRVQAGGAGAAAESGDITLNAAFAAAGDATLVLDAQRHIVINANGQIGTGNHVLNVTLNAGQDSTFSTPATNPGSITMAAGSSIGSGGGNVTATARGAVALAGVTTAGGSLTVTSNGGDITQTGAINAGAGSFDAGSAAIKLDQATNNFTGTVTLANSGNNDVTLKSNGALAFGASSVGRGTLTVNTSGGAITQSGAITQAAAVAGLAGTPSASFTASGAITLFDPTNTFSGTLSLHNSGANAVSVISSGALTLGESSVGSTTLTAVAAAGTLTQTGAITQETGATQASFTGNGITLDNAGNALRGRVALNPGNNGASIILNNSVDTTLSSSELGASALTVTSGGSLAQFGALMQSDTVGVGAVSFSAAGAITLTHDSNNFYGAVSLNTPHASGASIRDTNALVLGASSIPNGGLTVRSGTLTQTGALTVGGALGVTINATAGTLRDVLLADYANDIGGAVTFANGGAGGTIGNLALRNVAAGAAYPTAMPATMTALTLTYNNGNIVLPALNLSGALNVTAGGTLSTANALSVGGNLALSANGDIGQASAWTVGGSTTIGAGAHTILLDQSANAFSGAVSLTNTGNNAVTLVNTPSLVLGASSSGGTLSVTTGGALSQSGAITAARLNATAQDGITLNGANQVAAFSATNTGSGGVALTNTTPQLLITGSGVTTSSGDIALDNTGVNGILVSAPVTATSGGVALTAHSPITVGANLTAGTSIALTASSDITVNTGSTLNASTAIGMTAQSGNISVADGSLLTVNGGGTITVQAPSGYIEANAAVFSGAAPALSSGQPSPAAIAAAAAVAKAAADAAAKAAADAAAKAAADAAAKAAADAADQAAADAAAKAAADAAAKAAADKALADAAAKAAADAALKAAADKALADAAAKAAADKAAADAAAKAAADKALADAAAKAAADKAIADAAAQAAADKAVADAAAKAAADKALADAAAKAAADKADADAAAKAAADKALADAAVKAAADKALADAAAKAAADKAAADAAAKAAADKAVADAAAKAAADKAAADKALADAAAKAAADKAAADASAKAAADKAVADAAAKAAADRAAADAAAKVAAEKAAADAAAKASADKAAADAAAKAAADKAAVEAAVAQAAAEEAARQAADLAAKAAASVAKTATVEAPKSDTAKSDTKDSGSQSGATAVTGGAGTTTTATVLAQVFEQQTIGGGDNSFGGGSTASSATAASSNGGSGSDTAADGTAAKTDDKKDEKKEEQKDGKTEKKETKKMAVCS
ncbi:MAG: filamentous hemagglutinin N-terminal domain-containing protein [Pseudomonadota bacterium]